MPSQSKQEQVVNTFVKGLVTEAGEMTFPENASVDELNCDLRRDGTRRRRLVLRQKLTRQTQPLPSQTTKRLVQVLGVT